MKRTHHVGIHRDLVIKVLQDHPEDLHRVLIDWKGSAEEAIAELEKGPEFLVGPACDHRGPDGACLGHPGETSD